ncbi:MAG TPA: TA system VapC family ribonuclease toxin [Candidatus Acidoferrum sp.]|nr:TA system VapC family ribonuclease toxin [Candidatus Acidoferrum sp.]
MNTLNFPDANVWLALVLSRHTLAARAKVWFDGCGDERFYFCRFTQMTTLRLLTTEAVMGAEVKKMAEAWALVDQFYSDERIAFLQEPEGMEKEFRRLTSLSAASPKVWSDSYLLAFAHAAGLKLVTFDRGLRAKGTDLLVL